MEHVLKQNFGQEFKCDKHGGQKNHWYVPCRIVPRAREEAFQTNLKPRLELPVRCSLYYIFPVKKWNMDMGKISNN